MADHPFAHRPRGSLLGLALLGVALGLAEAAAAQGADWRLLDPAPGGDDASQLILEHLLFPKPGHWSPSVAPETYNSWMTSTLGKFPRY